MDGRVGAFLLASSVWAVGGAAAGAEEPEEATGDREERGEPSDGEELVVDGLADAVLLDSIVHGADNDDGRGGGTCGGDDDGQRGEERYEVRKARGDARAETEEADDQLESGGDHRDDVDDLDPAVDGDVGLNRIGDGVRDGDVLARGLDGSRRDVGLESGDVQCAGGPVEAALGAPIVIVGRVLVAVVPHIHLVTILEAEGGRGDVGVAKLADIQIVVVARDALEGVEGQGQVLGRDAVHVNALAGQSGRHDDENAYQRAQGQEEGDGDAEEAAGAHGDRWDWLCGGGGGGEESFRDGISRCFVRQSGDQWYAQEREVRCRR